MAFNAFQSGFLPPVMSPGGWGQYLSGPIIQGLTGLATTRQQNRLQTEYDADADRQIADYLNVFSQMGPEQLATYDASARPQLGTLQGLQALTGQRGNQYLGATLQGGRDRYRWAENNLEGYGDQMRSDIDRGFDQSLATTLAGMQERGIGSTTAVGSQRNLSQELRGSEQRRLGDDLTRMRQDILGGLQGDNLMNLLAAMQYRDIGDTGSMANLANFYGQNAAERANIVGGGYAGFGNAIGNINFVPPGPNQFPAQMGQNLVDPPDYSKANMF